jgi:hypothetical protein
MANVKEHTVVITNVSEVVNGYLMDGWVVVSVTPQYVSTGGASHLNGKFCFVLER